MRWGRLRVVGGYREGVWKMKLVVMLGAVLSLLSHSAHNVASPKRRWKVRNSGQPPIRIHPLPLSKTLLLLIVIVPIAVEGAKEGSNNGSGDISDGTKWWLGLGTAASIVSLCLFLFLLCVCKERVKRLCCRHRRSNQSTTSLQEDGESGEYDCPWVAVYGPTASGSYHPMIRLRGGGSPNNSQVFDDEDEHYYQLATGGSKPPSPTSNQSQGNKQERSMFANLPYSQTCSDCATGILESGYAICPKCLCDREAVYIQTEGVLHLSIDVGNCATQPTDGICLSNDKEGPGIPLYVKVTQTRREEVPGAYFGDGGMEVRIVLETPIDIEQYYCHPKRKLIILGRNASWEASVEVGIDLRMWTASSRQWEDVTSVFIVHQKPPGWIHPDLKYATLTFSAKNRTYNLFQGTSVTPGPPEGGPEDWNSQSSPSLTDSDQEFEEEEERPWWFKMQSRKHDPNERCSVKVKLLSFRQPRAPSFYRPLQTDGTQVVFELDDKTRCYFPKEILESASPMFKALLSGKFKDTDTEAVELHGINTSDFKRLLSYLKGQITTAIIGEMCGGNCHP